MPIDPREIRARGHGLVEIIDSDRRCNGCGYNLKGLRTTGVCPECGRPIAGRSRARRFTDNLADAPISYLKALALGLGLAAGASLVCVLVIASNALLPSKWTPPRWAEISLGIMGLMAVVWIVGVFIATGPRALGPGSIREPILDSRWLRAVNRGAQALLLAAGLMLLLFMRTQFQVFWYGAQICIVAALFGLVPLAVQFSSLADWAGDTSLSERFKVAAWAMAFLGVLAQAGFLATGPVSNLRGLLWLLAIWSSMGLAIAQIVFLVALVQLAGIATWAIRNSSTAAAVNRRLQENRDARAMELAERTATALALQKHGPPAKTVGPVRTAMDVNQMPRPKDGADPYALEPEPVEEEPLPPVHIPPPPGRPG